MSCRAIFVKYVIAVGAFVTAANTAIAAETTLESATLKRIKETGTITLGVRDSSIPFAYLDDNQQYVGYSVDLCMKVVSAIQKGLGLSQLNVKFNPVTAATRIPLMANGTIDLECSSTTNNAERQKQVAFSPSHFVAGNRVLSKKTANIKQLDDLKGKTVVATAGSTNLKQVVQYNADRNLGMNIVSSKDTAEGFLMVETGRAVAFVLDDIQLAALAANSKSPNDYMITSESLSVEPYGLMFRKDDPGLKKVVDDAIAGVYRSGDIHRIYAKWFQSPIPPKGINLNWPMSAEIKKAIEKPTNSPDPSAYK